MRKHPPVGRTPRPAHHTPPVRRTGPPPTPHHLPRRGRTRRPNHGQQRRQGRMAPWRNKLDLRGGQPLLIPALPPRRLQLRRLDRHACPTPPHARRLPPHPRIQRRSRLPRRVGRLLPRIRTGPRSHPHDPHPRGRLPLQRRLLRPQRHEGLLHPRRRDPIRPEETHRTRAIHGRRARSAPRRTTAGRELTRPHDPKENRRGLPPPDPAPRSGPVGPPTRRIRQSTRPIHHLPRHHTNRA